MEAARSRPRREWRGEPACRPPTGNEDQITPEEIEQARQLAESMLSQKDWQLNLQAYVLCLLRVGSSRLRREIG